jgi:hypothetical protein
MSAESLPERSAATPADLPDDAEPDAPDAVEYALFKRGGDFVTWELCDRDEHRCVRLDGLLHCADCDLVEEIPESGVQTVFEREVSR